MTDSEFNELIDDTLLSVEKAIEDVADDIEFEAVGGILTLTFANHSKIIINRQAAVKQLWVAAKSGGFHFNFDGEEWVSERSGKSLEDLLTKLCSEQAGRSISLALKLVK